MKHFYLALALLALAGGALSAKSKLSLSDKMLLHNIKLEQQISNNGAENLTTNPMRSRAQLKDSKIGAIVELADGYSVDDLTAAGAVVNTVYDEFVFVSIPKAIVEEFSNNAAVARIQLDRPVTMNNNMARTSVKAHRIHAGVTLPQAYTGAGVLAGVFDIGMDPHHPAFMTNDNSATRVKRVFLEHYADGSDDAENIIYSSTGETQASDGTAILPLSDFITENENETHGTHVAGTMAGGKAGSSTYYGMAYDADIAMATTDGNTTTVAIANGIAAIADYGKEIGKPIVVNCSFGSNYGVHDGTDWFSRMMDKVVEKTNAIICVSSGNDGDSNLGYHQTFTKDQSLTTTFDTSSKGVYYGEAILLGADDTPFDVTIAIVDLQTGLISEEMATVDENLDGGMYYFVTKGLAQTDDEGNTITNPSAALDSYWGEAYYGVGSEVISESNRYAVYLSFYFNKPTDVLTSSSYRYAPIFIVKGKAGQEVWGYTTQAFGTKNFAGWVGGSPNGTVSSIACGNSIICVGSYVSRDSYTDCVGNTHAINAKVGTVSSWSSYGDIYGGRSLPVVCAPGQAILSAVSSPYMYANSSVYPHDDCAAYEEVDGRINAYVSMSGTSMACPVATGIMALWKQANPDLTVSEAIDIIKKTSIAMTADDPTKAGAGKIDALAGLKEVIALGNSGVDAMDADARILLTPIGDKSFELYVAGETALKAVLYNMSGAAVLSASAQGNSLNINAESLAAGVYVLAVEGTTTHYSQRILVK
jgi:hypothetical protein